MKAPSHVIEIFLQPGELYFGDRNTRIRTLLGSCIAITLWHPKHLIGGMCHFMLPTRGKSNSKVLDGRYADEAMLLFRREIKAAGSNPKEFKAKIFGGGNMFQTPSRCLKNANCHNVACRNVMTAKELLKLHGIAVAAEHVGDNGHRNVVFDVWSGDVWLRHVKNSDLNKKANDA